MESYSVPHFLKRHLEKIQEKNASFSLRALAQKVEMSPGGLAQIMNGKKKISLKRAIEVAGLLKLNKKNRDFFITLAELGQTNNPNRKAELIEKLNRTNKKQNTYFDLSIENFKLVSKWYGFAILECVSSYGSSWDAVQLARHFNIKINEARLTLERLERLELIEKNNKGLWTRVPERVLSQSDYASESLIKHYRSSHKKSEESLKTQSPNSRITGTEFFAINKKDLKKMRELTYEYLDNLQELANNSKNPNTTYQAIVNLFSLTNIKESK